MNYEAVFVDWDGTLSNSRFWERWRDDPDQSEKYARINSALFGSASDRNLLHQWMTGGKTYGYMLMNLQSKTGIPYKDLEAELRYSAENMQIIDDTALTQIQKLRDIGKHVVIATDNMDVFDRWTVPALDLNNHFDDILNSNKIRALKSDIHPIYVRSNFFHKFFNDMGIAPSNSVLIDNSLDARCLEDIGIGFHHVTDETPLTYHLQSIINEYE